MRTHLNNGDGKALCGVEMDGDVVAPVDFDPDAIDCVTCMWRDIARIAEVARREVAEER